MDQIEKQVAYTSTNSYAALNTLTDKTKNIWIVLHGIGYLSRYFLKYFASLPPDENYIIAPQAPSKYYLNNEYRYVGASWFTKVDKVQETRNVIAYLDAIYAAEHLPEKCELIVFGFSQGVSIATRWVAQRQLKCNRLVLYAGEIPEELKPEDFGFLNDNSTKVTVIVGDKDEYLTEERRRTESEKIEKLFLGKAQQITFEGGHEVKKELVAMLVK